jgi:OmcA/MtrC family decaheme c-type cytochrome
LAVAPATATDLTPGHAEPGRRPDRHRPGRAEGRHRLHGRRAIVEDKRCNACHQELGAFTIESFHAGQRNDGTTCSWCHNPTGPAAAGAADSTAFVHCDPRQRQARRSPSPGTLHRRGVLRDIKFPGILNRCETCHLPGTYDFSASASASQESGRLFRTVATGTVVTATSTDVQKFAASPYVTRRHELWQRLQLRRRERRDDAGGRPTTLVNSPTAAACFACHDTALAQSHMTIERRFDL